MARIPTIAILGALALSAPLAAQEAFLAEVPTAQQVAGGLAVASPRETAARRYAALFALQNLVESLDYAYPSAEGKARVASFTGMRKQVYEAEKQRDAVPYLLERCGQAYSESPAFQRELLDLYFTPAWQATYGPRLDPRRWKAPLAMAPGARVTAASLSPPMVEECGSVPAAAAPRAVAATAPRNDPVEQQRAAAKAIMQAGDTARALEAYKRLVSAYPSRYEGYVGLGLIYVGQHQYALALPAWQKVVELAPTDAFSLYMVGMSYNNLRRYAEGRDVLRAVTRMQASPEVLGWAHFGLGMAYARLGQRDSAMQSYRALAVLDTALAGKLAVELNRPPPAQEATAVAGKAAGQASGQLAAQGDAYLKQGDTTRALEAFEASVASQPPDLDGYVGLGRIYTARREYSLSVPAWQRAAALAPTDWSVLWSLGVAYMGLKSYPEARDAYIRAIRTKPPSEFIGYIYLGLGATYLQLGQRDSAVAVYRVLVPIDTARASALAARINAADKQPAGSLPPAGAAKPLTAAQKAEVGRLRAEGKKYYNAKQYAKARTSYENLLRLDPNDAWALYELGTSMLMIEGSDDTDSMLAVWKRAVDLKPTDTKLLLSLGDALYTWDPAVAFDALQRVIAISPDAATQAEAHAIMGWAHYFFLDNSSADAEFKEALRLDPSNDQYLYNIGINYAKAGQRDAAMGVFRQLTTRNQKMAQELLEAINKKKD